MALQVCKSDIIISIHPRHIANIVSRIKNHEFRKYLLPAEVRRLWIYETRPASSVKYVATISAGKRPGELHDPTGLRNDEFDEGRLEHLVKYAYKIHRLEALAAPISLSDLKRNGWLNGPPQKYCYIKQSMRQALSVTPLTLVFDSIIMVSASASSDGAASSDANPDAKPERLQKSPQKGYIQSRNTKTNTRVHASSVARSLVTPDAGPLQPLDAVTGGQGLLG